MSRPLSFGLWRRVVATVFCLAWAAMELATGAAMWAILFGAAGLYLAWQFFMVFSPAPDDEGGET